MRVFATSDFHGNRTIMDKLRIAAEQADLIVICGDIGSDGPDCQDTWTKQREDKQYLLDVLEQTGTDFRFILGDHDWMEEYAHSSHITCCDIYHGFKMFPFELVPISPAAKNREANVNQLNYAFWSIWDPHNAVIVAHTPPYGACDKGDHSQEEGRKLIRKWIEENKPRLWLCGHLHENYGISKIGETTVLNCACDPSADELRGWMIDTETGEFNKASF